MAKKQTSKRAFDWASYSRPTRLLTDAQEQALREGLLGPVLELALTDRSLRLEIRVRQAALYERGANLLRLSGDAPFIAELDVSHRLPREQRTGERLERMELADADDVARCLEALTSLRDDLTASWSADELTDRTVKQAVASAHGGDDLWADELVVVDLEYTYGKRRYDLLALRRSPGITGPGGFANPRLVFVHVQRAGTALAGNSGPAAVASDLAEFVKALGGEHLERCRAEVAELVEQKTRLGLLPDLDFRGLTAEMPEFLVVFTVPDVSTPDVDASVIEVHDRLLARHFPIERLRFAHMPEGSEGILGKARLTEPDIMSYRAFKEYRRHG